MAAALIGFLGVVIGLAVGRGYGFWAERRSELAEAAVAAAALAEELRKGDQPDEASKASLRRTWTDHRRWLVVHLSPRDYRLLADAIEPPPKTEAPLRGEDLVKRLDALHGLFWEEHEAFILVPLIHYLRGYTVSKRSREILDPAREIDALPPRGERSSARSWHSPSEPSEHPTQTIDS